MIFFEENVTKRLFDTRPEAVIVKQLNDETVGRYKYVTLANGLNFQVTSVEVSENGLILLNLMRFNKLRNETNYSFIITDTEGFYLPNKEPSSNDIVKFSTESEAWKTQAGLKNEERTNFDLTELNPNKTTKIQVRSGTWFTLKGIYQHHNSDKITLNLFFLGAESRPRNRDYYLNGKDYSENKKQFSPYDIMRIVEQ